MVPGWPAGLGYLARRAAHGASFDDYWRSESATELYHFIGKDISYFHTLFWPAVLYGAGLRRPSAVFAHGFLTINGQKMSKSRGTFITARHYLDRLPPEPLRYYFAAKLSNGIEDIDFSLEDFLARTNSDLIGKLVNIASRCAGFIERGGGRLAPALADTALYNEFIAASESIAARYEAREYAMAIRDIMELADRANRFVDQHKPWLLARDSARAAEVRAIATQGLNLFRVLMSCLAPVLPQMAQSAATFLGTSFAQWSAIGTPLLDSPIAPYQALATRLDPVAVAALVEPGEPGEPQPTVPDVPSIGIEEFARLDLRVARVAQAALVEGSNKLLRLTLDVGGQERTVFSGIRAAYAPEQLIGRQVILVANLAPRKMRFGISEGMVLCAAGEQDAQLFLLTVDQGALPGMKVS
jgi:methionyl-tRNA synthetase